MSDAPLVAQSLAEVYLYLLATPCASCGRGPLRGGEAESGDSQAGGNTVIVAATCGSCQSVTRWKIQLDGPPQTVPTDQAPVVNSTDEPSRMLDVAQWLTLFGIKMDAAGKELTKSASENPLTLPSDPPYSVGSTDPPGAGEGLRMHSKTAARKLSLEAAQCLDEALKFYEEDNDLPPNDAFFHAGSRDRFRDHPQHFSRQRLLHLRSKLPTPWPMRPGGE